MKNNLKILEKYKDIELLIYGADGGIIYLKWFYERKYHKSIRRIIDKSIISPSGIILHLMSLYYFYSPNDIIINVTLYDNVKEIESVGDSWSIFEYTDNQIVNICNKLYGS